MKLYSLFSLVIFSLTAVNADTFIPTSEIETTAATITSPSLSECPNMVTTTLSCKKLYTQSYLTSIRSKNGTPECITKSAYCAQAMTTPISTNPGKTIPTPYTIPICSWKALPPSATPCLGTIHYSTYVTMQDKLCTTVEAICEGNHPPKTISTPILTTTTTTTTMTTTTPPTTNPTITTSTTLTTTFTPKTITIPRCSMKKIVSTSRTACYGEIKYATYITEEDKKPCSTVSEYCHRTKTVPTTTTTTTTIPRCSWKAVVSTSRTPCYGEIKYTMYITEEDNKPCSTESAYCHRTKTIPTTTTTTTTTTTIGECSILRATAPPTPCYGIEEEKVYTAVEGEDRTPCISTYYECHRTPTPTTTTTITYPPKTLPRCTIYRATAPPKPCAGTVEYTTYTYYGYNSPCITEESICHGGYITSKTISTITTTTTTETTTTTMSYSSCKQIPRPTESTKRCNGPETYSTYTSTQGGVPCTIKESYCPGGYITYSGCKLIPRPTAPPRPCNGPEAYSTYMSTQSGLPCTVEERYCPGGYAKTTPTSSTTATPKTIPTSNLPHCSLAKALPNSLCAGTVEMTTYATYEGSTACLSISGICHGGYVRTTPTASTTTTPKTIPTPNLPPCSLWRALTPPRRCAGTVELSTFVAYERNTACLSVTGICHGGYVKTIPTTTTTTTKTIPNTTTTTTTTTTITTTIPAKTTTASTTTIVTNKPKTISLPSCSLMRALTPPRRCAGTVELSTYTAYEGSTACLSVKGICHGGYVKTIPTTTTTITKTIPNTTTTTTTTTEIISTSDIDSPSSSSSTISVKTIPTTITTTIVIPSAMPSTKCVPQTVSVTVTERETITVKEKETITVKDTMTVTVQTTTTVSTRQNCGKRWAQCGGNGFTGPTCCQSGLTCRKLNNHYSQCI